MLTAVNTFPGLAPPPVTSLESAVSKSLAEPVRDGGAEGGPGERGEVVTR